MQVVKILKQGESRTHCKTHDGRIHQEPDSTGTKEEDHHHCLEAFFHQWCNITGVGFQRQTRLSEDPAIEVQGGDGAKPTGHDDPQHGFQADQFVAVHVDQGNQEHQNRQQAYWRLGE